jgi:DNA polymerase/3'-5' exonuclease PolX
MGRPSTLEKPLYTRKLALTAAAALEKALGSSCEKFEIAGSVRRGLQYVHDVDIVAVPILYRDKAKGEMFEVQLSKLDEKLAELLAAGRLTVQTNGEHSKRFLFVMGRQNDKPGGIPIDIYVTDKRAFPGVLLCRTGSRLHNVKFCELANQRGLRFRPTGGFMRLGDSAKEIWPKDEKDYYAQLGLAWINPPLRENPRFTEVKDG